MQGWFISDANRERSSSHRILQEWDSTGWHRSKRTDEKCAGLGLFSTQSIVGSGPGNAGELIKS
jgi:hypothetical protein